jgi:hypothetical protein
MAFRATNSVPEGGLNNAKRLAVSIKNTAITRAAFYASGADSDNILALADEMRRYSIALTAIKSIPGIGQYARDQEGDANYDIVAEFNALIAGVDAVVSQIVSTFPVDSSGFLLSHTIAGDGQRSARNFPSAALSGLVAVLNNLNSIIS